MLSIKTAVYEAPSVADIIMVFHNTLKPPTVTVEHFDASSLISAPICYMESDDGSSWSIIGSTPTTINPGDSNTQTISSSRSRIALHAAGGVPLQVTLVRQVNGAPLDLGVA